MDPYPGGCADGLAYRVIMYGLVGGIIFFFIWFHTYQQKKRDRLKREQQAREQQWQSQWENRQPVSCGVCGDEVTGEHIDCPMCLAQHHPECWKLNDGCGKCDLSA